MYFFIILDSPDKIVVRRTKRLEIMEEKLFEKELTESLIPENDINSDLLVVIK